MAGTKRKTVKSGTGSRRTASSSARRRTTSSGASASSGRRTGKETKRVVRQKQSFLQSEIGTILLIAAGFFLLLSDFGLMGSFGGLFLKLQKGMFGQGFFLFAVALGGAALTEYLERGKSLCRLKIAAVFLAFLALDGLIQLFLAEKNPDRSVIQYTISELYQVGAEGGKGGGLFGGFLGNILQNTVGSVGAFLLLAVLLIICGVVISEKSFVSIARFGAQKAGSAVRYGAGKTVEAARTGHQRYAEYQQETRARRNAEREENRRLRELREKEAAEQQPKQQEIPRERGLSDLTLAKSTAASDDAFSFNRYGKELISSRSAEKSDSTADLSRDSLYRRRDNLHTEAKDQESGVINTMTEQPEAIRPPVNVKEINYDTDTVPFEETEDEKYKSYAAILNSGVIHVSAANMAGYAVGVKVPEKNQGNLRIQSLDSYREKDDEGYVYDETGFEVSYRDTAAEKENSRPERETMPAYDSVLSEPVLSGSAATGPVISEPVISEQAVSEPSVSVPDDFDEQGPEIIFSDNDDRPESWNEEESEPAPFDEGETYNSREEKESGEAYEQDEEPEEISEPATFSTATGKEMEAPDSYEAALIMKNKGASAGTAVQPARKTAEIRQNPPADKGDEAEKPKPKPYVFPRINLLERGTKASGDSREEIRANAAKLERVLRDFGVGVRVTNVIRGPRVSRYEMIPDTGVKVSRITSLQGDIKLALAATELRIEAPIPGKSAVGIEVPNSESQTVRFRDILESEEFAQAKSKMAWGIGLDIQGKPVIGDIAKMPHVLVAGTTGSGKSVGINSLIMSILYRSTPDDVRMILIDPKVVELSVYNGIPHLLTPVVTKPEKAVSALNWAVSEMNNRYKLFQQSGTRNIGGYNEKVEKLREKVSEEECPKKLPYILIVIDELSELMMHSKKDVEAAIVSLTQLARAAGIHLVVATQRPSVDVITGLIKSNIPSRIAYRLPSVVDSRTILDSGGAESLLGNGDMLYKPGDKNSPARIQGAFLSDEEVESVVDFVRRTSGGEVDHTEFDDAVNAQMELDLSGISGADSGQSDQDEYFADAGRLIINSQKASIGALQRKFKIGFNRAARIMDQLHEAGVVSDSEGTKERQILMSLHEFEQLLCAQHVQ